MPVDRREVRVTPELVEGLVQVVLQVQLGRLVRQVFVELLVVQVQLAAQVLQDQLGQLVLSVLQASWASLVLLAPVDQLAEQEIQALLDHKALQVCTL